MVVVSETTSLRSIKKIYSMITTSMLCFLPSEGVPKRPAGFPFQICQMTRYHELIFIFYRKNDSLVLMCILIVIVIIVNIQHLHCCCCCCFCCNHWLSHLPAFFSPFLSYKITSVFLAYMSAQRPTEYTTEEDHSFCNCLRYWIGGSIQVHMICSVQITNILAAGCEIQHRFESRYKKKFRDMAECYFSILDEDLEDHGICSTTTSKSQLRDAWVSKDKSIMTGDTLWRKWQEIRNKLPHTIISS